MGETILGPVTVTKLRDWTSKKDPSKSGRDVYFKAGELELRFPLAVSNGYAVPVPGEVGGLVLELAPEPDDFIYNGKVIRQDRPAFRCIGFQPSLPGALDDAA